MQTKYLVKNAAGMTILATFNPTNANARLAENSSYKLVMVPVAR